MMKATWNGATIAESDATVVIEGNHYFPADSLNWDVLEQTTHHTSCPWKGEASYYSITTGGQTNANAAWTYAEPKQAASEIKGYIAFWKGVDVKEVADA